MPNVDRAKQHFKEPSTLKVGPDEASELAAIIAGSVSVNFGAISAGAIASASAAFAGMTSSFNIVALPQLALDANGRVSIVAAAGITDGIQLTGANQSGSAIDPAATTIGFFAFR